MVNYLDSRRIMGTSSEKPKVFSTGCKAYYNAEITTTLDEDFSSYADQTSANNTWIRTNTSSDNVRANATTDVLDCINDNTASTTSDTVYYDLGSALSDTAWVCRFTLDLTSFTPRSDTNSQFSSFRIASTTGTGNPAQDSMGLNLYTHTGVGNKYEAVAQDNAAFDFHIGGASSDTLSVETKYVEMIRNGDTITVKFYNNSSYGSVVESFSDTQTGVTGLRYVKAQARRTTSSAHGIISFTVDDIKIYDGVTSVSDLPFTNKATTGSGFADGFGNSANGTNSGTTTTTGKLGSYAWSFDGTNDYVDISNKFDAFTQEGSVSCWIKPNTISNNDILFDNNNATGTNQGFLIRFETGELIRFNIIGATDTNIATPTSTWTTGSWQHLVVTFDGTTGKIYKNGSEVASGSMTALTQTPTYNLRIGWAANGNDNKYDGDMDEVAIFYRALTADEVSTLYNSGTGLAVPTNDLNVETNSIFIETDTASRYWFDGSEWIDPTIPIYGLFGGGGTPTVQNTIDYITIATTGNATDFGDLTQSRNSIGATDDNSRGVWAGGYNSGAQNTIDYVTIGTTGNATDFGDLTESRYPLGGASNNVRGIFGGGYNAGFKNTIDYITIQTAGNATDFGDLTVARDHLDAVDDSSRAVWGGGESPPTNTMDYVTIATTGNATDFGDLTVARYYASGVASDTRGVFAGGHDGYNTLNPIDYITIQTTGNATDFGDLSIAKHQMAGVSNLSRGCYSGGTNYYVDIEYITISTTGNSTDFGDLTQGRNTPAGVDGS